MANKKVLDSRRDLTKAQGILLSIDFDYFVPTPAELPAEYRFSRMIHTPYGPKLLGSLFDYGHSEFQNAEINDIIWRSRLVSMLAAGLHPQDWLSADEGLIASILAYFTNAKTQEGAKVYVADSHAMARSVINAIVSGQRAPLLRLINIDAHGDVGYDDGRLQKEIDGKISTAESWLFHALHDKVVDSAYVYYPSWKGDVEERHRKESRLFRRVTDRVFFNTGIIGTPAWKGAYSGIFVCRSSAWTSPVSDAAFESFITQLRTAVAPNAPVIDLDHEYNTGRPSVLQRRSLDWEDLHNAASIYAKAQNHDYNRPIAGTTRTPTVACEQDLARREETLIDPDLQRSLGAL